MQQPTNAVVLTLCSLATALTLYAQSPKTAPQPGADVLIFIDGEKLIGQLEHATDSSVTFKSNMAGEITVALSKVQELRTVQRFAAIPKGLKARRSEDTANVPRGTVTLTSKQLEIASAPGAAPQIIPIGNVAALVPQPDFERAFHAPGFAAGWTGGATAGLSLTEATQKDQTFTAALNLVRAVPSENWLDVRNRTIFDYNEAYSKLTQPATPAVKTSLFHVDAEQDHYLSPRLFVFGQAMFDHSVSQGLDLQQTYGGGLGIVVFKTTKHEFDFKASADYIDQRFVTAALNKKLVGSIFGEAYIRKFAHGILLNEQGGITPAWNNTSAYSAFASAGLTLPVYHHFGLTLGALENFVNDPPPAFKKNSFQFTLGATYSFQPPR
jgi:putative salt-induced outer membrane protein YdiY